jgi:(2Fe-2S) ferredoxin
MADVKSINDTGSVIPASLPKDKVRMKVYDPKYVSEKKNAGKQDFIKSVFTIDDNDDAADGEIVFRVSVLFNTEGSVSFNGNAAGKVDCLDACQNNPVLRAYARLLDGRKDNIADVIAGGLLKGFVQSTAPAGATGPQEDISLPTASIEKGKSFSLSAPTGGWVDGDKIFIRTSKLPAPLVGPDDYDIAASNIDGAIPEQTIVVRYTRAGVDYRRTTKLTVTQPPPQELEAEAKAGISNTRGLPTSIKAGEKLTFMALFEEPGDYKALLVDTTGDVTPGTFAQSALVKVANAHEENPFSIFSLSAMKGDYHVVFVKQIVGALPAFVKTDSRNNKVVIDEATPAGPKAPAVTIKGTPTITRANKQWYLTATLENAKQVITTITIGGTSKQLLLKSKVPLLLDGGLGTEVKAGVTNPVTLSIGGHDSDFDIPVAKLGGGKPKAADKAAAVVALPAAAPVAAPAPAAPAPAPKAPPPKAKSE